MLVEILNQYWGGRLPTASLFRRYAPYEDVAPYGVGAPIYHKSWILLFRHGKAVPPSLAREGFLTRYFLATDGKLALLWTFIKHSVH